MLIRTHLAINILFIVLFLPHMIGNTAKIIFAIVALFATFLPDIDTGYSTIGKPKAFRFMQFFVRHRGMIHSLTIPIVISLIFALFVPVLALPFFLGYSLHIFADSFTKEGIVPFWPMKKESKWHLRTGGRVETSLFIAFLIVDVLVIAFMIGS